jgi:hypothetical protein
MEYRHHHTLGRFLFMMPQELRQKIIWDYFGLMKHRTGQAQKLQWVVDLAGVDGAGGIRVIAGGGSGTRRMRTASSLLAS